MSMEYRVNGTTLRYKAAGETRAGEDRVLLQDDVDLTDRTQWARPGYTVEKLFNDEKYFIFKRNVTQLLCACWQKANLYIPSEYRLDQYHLFASGNEQHLAAVEATKLIDVEYFPLYIRTLEDRISEICNRRLMVKNPFDGQTVFHFRVIRPGQKDNNPLHRDVWLDDYKSCINLYIPIVGSNEKSSLIIIPGSHHWPESRVERTVGGAEINGVKFNVPAVTKISGETQFVRPDPKENEVLVFSPYLIHGGSSNLNEDITRISMEIRLWEF